MSDENETMGVGRADYEQRRRFKVGDRVVPVGPTKDGLTYGYVREITADRGYRVYWPEISTDGDGWWDHDLFTGAQSSEL